ncbi:MAG: hypothetical protein J0I12_12590 [Candidatus Eremiobacteraeota bacterium]|nr:hypothetical protein [Candidatus Eremiobacteraeota bacterium]
MRRRRQAFILPLAVLLCFLMLLIAFVLQDQSRKQMRFASLQVRAEQAANAADAGLVIALQQLASNPAYTGVSTLQTLAEGPETYKIAILQAGASMPDGQTVPSGNLFALASGYSLGNANARSGALVKVGTSGSKGLPGVYGSSVRLSGGAFVDSYNSTKGAYLIGSKNGSVLTNSTSAGSVIIEGASQIYGPVSIGPKGVLDPNSSGGTTMNSAYTVWRDWSTSYVSSSLQTSAKDMPAVTLPSAVGKTSVSMSWGTNTLAPGNYDSVSIGNAGTLTLKAGVYVMNSFSIGGGANIQVAGDGPVQIYVAKSFSLNNGAVVSNSKVSPSLLQINMADGSTYDQQGGTQLTGVVYGPSATANLSNGSTIYGSLSGNSVKIAGASWVHYDEALSEFSLGGSSSSGSTSGLTVLFRQRW